MKRNITISSLLLVGLALGWVGLAGGKQNPILYGIVNLQDTTPGSPQTGNTNVSGTSIAGQFEGGGAGLVGLDASNLGIGIVPIARFPVPLTLSGTSPTHILSAENASSADNSTAVLGRSTAASGSTFGGYFQNDSTSGIGVAGFANAASGSPIAGYFESNGPSGYGVYATTQGFSAVTGTSSNVSGSSSGGLFQCNSTSGYGVYGQEVAASGATYGGYFQSGSTSGTGVSGVAYSIYGFTFGGYFESNSPDGRAVRAVNNATTGWAVAGRFGTGSSTSGIGVWSTAGATSGVTYGIYGESSSTSGRGVFGYAGAPNGNTTYAVLGDNALNGSGWGVYALGNLGGSGAKLFRIDHPLDPENKYLQHYCAEGPEPKNIYDGTVRTDARGYAAVTLPDYYQEINRDARIQLTVVDEEDSDSFVMAKVVQKVRGNGFRIRTSAPGVEVFWRVEAVRNDLWVRKYGAPVEVEKQELERGKYQHPELYGQPKERGIFDRPEEAPGQRPGGGNIGKRVPPGP